MIKFIKPTHLLPLPKPETMADRSRKTTFNILNNTKAGSGAVQIEIVCAENDNLTSSPLANLNADKDSCKAQQQIDLQPCNYCCSGIEYCIVKKPADEMKHVCPLCSKVVHAVCGVVNPDFENDKVGI